MEPGGILVTGAGGHIGSRLVAHLQHANHSVKAQFREVSRVPHEWRGEIPVVGDLLKSDVRAKAIAGIGTVAHLATRGFSNANPPTEELLSQEADVAVALAREAAGQGVKRFLFVSSIHVYGDALVGEIDENSQTSPRDLLGLRKLELEKRLLQIATDDFHVTVLRLANSFGTAGNPDHTPWDLLLNELCREAVVRRTMSLRTNGLQYRDFVPLGEVVRAITAIIHHPRVRTGTYLLASGNSRTVIESVERLALILQHNHDIVAEVRRGTSTNLVSRAFRLSTHALGELGITLSTDWSEEVRLLVEAASRFRDDPS